MMSGRHPYINASNFVIAEDTNNKILVASAIYMPWTYSYCGRKVKAVRLEEVFCEPKYQNQGIMKKILCEIAELYKEKGYLFELVYGTNAVYNHLGYTYGMPNEEEGYSFILDDEVTGNDFKISEANDEDIAKIAKLYETNYTRNLLTTFIGEKEIYYTKNVYVEGNYYIIKSSDGKVCGFFHTQLEDKRIYMMELDDSVSYYQIRPYLINFYKRLGKDRIYFKLGSTHPVYDVFGHCYKMKLPSELGFVKVYDIPQFLMSISDILSGRLAVSPYAHYKGSFTVAMHNRNEAYLFEWNNGILVSVIPVEKEYGEIDIERNRFIRLLFGRIPPIEMEQEFSMYYFDNCDLRNIFEIIFPQIQSHIVSIN
jgi:GNAT superfamily N-acetyltransferase